MAKFFAFGLQLTFYVLSFVAIWEHDIPMAIIFVIANQVLAIILPNIEIAEVEEVNP